MHAMSRVKRRRGKRRIFKLILLFICLLVIGVGIYAFSLYNKAKSTVNDRMHEQVDAIDTSLAKDKLKNKERLFVLLLGIDAEEGEKGRSDALIVLSLDPKTDAMKIVSIPRDTRTEIVGKGTEDKINHAYSFGSEDMAIATVENFLDIELDYYVSMNMDGFQELVDELGTISVTNDFAWSDEEYNFPEGKVSMDGEKAMHYVRMRKQDPDGDFGRNKRQRQVIEGIINEGASVASVTKVSNLVDVLGDNMKTNLDFDDMKALLANYRDTRKQMGEYQIQGEGTSINGIYYYIVNEQERQKVKEMLENE